MKEKETKKKDGRGGRREGAGRKPGVKIGPIKENPRNRSTAFSVSEKTLKQIWQLRELTRDDEVDFNKMFILWVEQTAKDYGIEE